MTGLLRGRALNWAEAFLSNTDSRTLTNQRSVEEAKVFAHPSVTAELMALNVYLIFDQSSVADYSVEFKILATQSGWDDRALRSFFVCSL